jgi:hypothetical protein
MLNTLHRLSQFSPSCYILSPPAADLLAREVQNERDLDRHPPVRIRHGQWKYDGTPIIMDLSRSKTVFAGVGDLSARRAEEEVK